MRHRTLAGASLLAAVGLALSGCSSQPSYEEKTNRCAAAIAARAAGDTVRPKACDDVSDDDYATLNLGHQLKSSGIVDGDGNVDTNKLIDPSSTP